MRNRYLLIGPYPHGHPNQIGGSTILFKGFVEYMETRKLDFHHLSITRYQGPFKRLVNLIRVLFQAIWWIPASRMIVVNVNRRGLLYLAPLLMAYARVWGRSMSLRMFGGDTDELDQSAQGLRKRLLDVLWKRSACLFFETQREVDYFSGRNANCHWFPNCRNVPLQFHPRNFKKRFVYISQIKKDKGIELLIEVFKALGPEYSLEVYGPILESELEWIRDSHWYKGVLSFDEVYDALNRNDVLVLPSFHPGEGYPGILIEAYFMSVPVITTRWRSIPDIVDQGRSGVLIEPRSVDSLKQAITNLNQDQYAILNRGAFEMSRSFQSDNIHERVIQHLKSTDKNKS
ncbi:MAG TPA: glycosyltransferase [Saprospiraceae bacterium]|nr:glycosyltransferase [Saprospiraceae bacterium]